MKTDTFKGMVDFGIITIREDEFDAVLQRFPPEDEAEGLRHYSISYTPTSNNDHYIVASVRCPEQGTGEGQNVARDLIEDLNPQWLVVVGIAGGVPSDDFSLGDVVAVTRIHDFCIEAAKEGENPEYATAGGPAHERVRELLAHLPAWQRGRLPAWNLAEAITCPRPSVSIQAKNFYGSSTWQKATRNSLTKHFGPAAEDRPPLVRTGSIASSDRLMKDTSTLRRWKETARQLLAVEMEVAGVYRAARRTTGEYPLLAIRGISDIVGFKRDDRWTKYACHSAASFAHAFLRARPIEPKVRSIPDWRARNRESSTAGSRAGSPSPDSSGSSSASGSDESHSVHKRLPVLPNHWVTRSDERTLSDLFEQNFFSAGATILLTGGPGTGKTVLGAKVARDHKTRYPDGVYYIDVRAREEEQVISDVIALFESTSPAPRSVDELIESIKEHTHGRRILIIFDDIRSRVLPAKLTEALKSVDVLLISQNRLEDPQIAAICALYKLDEETAIELAATVLHRRGHMFNRSKLRQLCKKLGCNPMAISIAAASMAARGIDEQAFIERLQKSGIRALPYMEATMQLAWEALSPKARRCLVALGQTGDANIPSSLAQAVIEDDEFDEGIDELILSSLLQRELTGEDRAIEVHSIVRLWARSRGAEELVAQARKARQRLLGWLNRLASTIKNDRWRPYLAAHIIEVSRQIPRDANVDALFEFVEGWKGQLDLIGEWFTLKQIWEITVEASCIANLPEHLSVARHNLGVSLQRLGDVSKARDLLKQSLEANERLGNLENLAASLHHLGSLAAGTGDFKHAKELSDRGLDIERRRGDESGISGALQLSGNLACELGDFEKAERLFQESLDIETKLGRPERIAIPLHCLGNLACYRCEYPKALEYYTRSLRHALESGDVDGIASTQHQIGFVSEKIGNYDQAEICYAESLSAATRLGNKDGMASSLLQISAFARRKGDLAKARQCLEQCLALAKDLEDKSRIAKIIHEQGLLLEQIGELDQAKMRFMDALARNRDLRRHTGEAIALHQLGMIARMQHHYDEARSNFEQSLAIKRKAANRAGIAATLNELGSLEVCCKNYQRGLEYYVESLNLKIEMHDKEGIGLCLLNLAALASDLHDYQLSWDYLDESLTLYQELGSDSSNHLRTQWLMAQVTYATGRNEWSLVLAKQAQAMAVRLNDPLIENINIYIRKAETIQPLSSMASEEFPVHDICIPGVFNDSLWTLAHRSRNLQPLYRHSGALAIKSEVLRAVGQLVFSPMVNFKVHGENIVAALLIKYLGTQPFLRLLSSGAIRFTLWTSFVARFNNPSKGMHPLAPVTMNTGPESDPYLSALLGIRSIGIGLEEHEIISISQAIAGSTVGVDISIPQAAAGSAISAYENGHMTGLGFNGVKSLDDLDQTERMRLCTIADQLVQAQIMTLPGRQLFGSSSDWNLWLAVAKAIEKRKYFLDSVEIITQANSLPLLTKVARSIDCKWYAEQRELAAGFRQWFWATGEPRSPAEVARAYSDSMADSPAGGWGPARFLTTLLRVVAN